jgi:hypothetical protein
LWLIKFQNWFIVLTGKQSLLKQIKVLLVKNEQICSMLSLFQKVIKSMSELLIQEKFMIEKTKISAQ